jgi:endonuclease-3
MARAVRVSSPRKIEKTRSTPSKSAPPSRAKPAKKSPVKPAKKSPVKPGRAAKDEPERVAAIIAGLEELYPNAHCELDFKTPFQLLVATILSAQCTDKRVNMVTPTLFASYGTPAQLAAASEREIEPIIKSTGFFRNKAKSIVGAARAIMEDHDGEMPRTMDELLELPGVARKTANVVLGSAFGLNEGFVVDTHVKRLANRLGLSQEDEPVKIERDLCARLPREKWTQLGHQLIWHGRRTCYARKPDCGHCALAPHCPTAGKVV